MEVPLWNWEMKYDWCLRDTVSKKGPFNCRALSALPWLHNFLKVAFTAGSKSLKITASKVLMVSGIFGEGAKEQRHWGCDRTSAQWERRWLFLQLQNHSEKAGFQTSVSLAEPAGVTHPCWRGSAAIGGKELRDGDGEWFLCILSCSERENFFPPAAYRDKLLK